MSTNGDTLLMLERLHYCSNMVHRLEDIIPRSFSFDIHEKRLLLHRIWCIHYITLRFALTIKVTAVAPVIAEPCDRAVATLTILIDMLVLISLE